MTQAFRFAAWQFVGGAVVAIAAPVMAVELPQIAVHYPGAEESYAAGATIVCAGQVQPAIRCDVEIRMFHETRTGELVRLCGVRVPQDRGGVFRVSMVPPATGWRPGTVLVEARLVDLQQVLLRRRINVAADDRPPAVERRIRLPASSGVAIDTARQQQAVVEAGKTFLVRGRFRARPRPGRIEGPFVTSKVLMHFGRGPIILQSDRTRSLVEAEDRFGFELQMVAPREPGKYLQTLEVHFDPADQNDATAGRWEIDLEVVAPRPKPQA